MSQSTFRAWDPPEATTSSQHKWTLRLGVQHFNTHSPADLEAHWLRVPSCVPVPGGCLPAPAMGEWTILERLLEAAVQQHSTMIGRWVVGEIWSQQRFCFSPVWFSAQSACSISHIISLMCMQSLKLLSAVCQWFLSGWLWNEGRALVTLILLSDMMGRFRSNKAQL